MHARRTFAAALTAPLLILSACDANSSVADPPASPSTPPSTPSPPRRETPEAFIRRWADAEKRMENTGRTRAYLAISPECAACRKLANTVRSYYTRGGYVRWGGWRIISIKMNSRQGRKTTYEVINRSLPTAYRECAHKRLRHFAGGVTTELLQLQRVHGRWTLTSKAELAT